MTKMMKIKYLKFQEHRIKFFYPAILFLNSISLEGQIVTAEDNYFQIKNTSFGAIELSQKGVRRLECYGTEINLGKNLTVSPSEQYSAAFDSNFRIIHEQYTSTEDSSSVEYSYLGNVVLKNEHIWFKEHSSDTFFTPEMEIIKKFKNNKLVSVAYEYHKKRLKWLSRYDTTIYNEKMQPICTYKLWTNNTIPESTDTLKVDYFYDSSGKLTSYKQYPVGGAETILRYSRGSATILFDAGFYDYLVMEDSSSSKTIGPLTGFTFKEHLSLISTEANIYKVNDRFFELSLDIVPRKWGLEANKNWIKKIEYLDNTRLPKKIMVLYGDTIMVYEFSYFQ